jgi:hypothetical protein
LSEDFPSENTAEGFDRDSTKYLEDKTYRVVSESISYKSSFQLLLDDNEAKVIKSKVLHEGDRIVFKS